MSDAPKRKTRKDAYYINNKEFTAEIMSCKRDGKLSDKAVNFFIILANRTIQKLKFSNPLDKEDCIQSALLDLVRYWPNFDDQKSNNAFAYFTQIAKNGYAKEYKRIHKHIGKGEKVEIISLSSSGESEIYTI
jgi:DNA-directed RNA polymerase specialized sigma subunit